MILRYVLLCGGAAGAVSLAGLSVASLLEGREPWRPANATSHWWHGDKAGELSDLDLAHTGLGLATHQGSAMFWGLPFGAWLAIRPKRSLWQMIRDASAMSAIAAAFDYLVVPKRLTPGWELALSKRSVAGGFAALAAGLAIGGLIAQSMR